MVQILKGAREAVWRPGHLPVAWGPLQRIRPVPRHLLPGGVHPSHHASHGHPRRRPAWFGRIHWGGGDALPAEQTTVPMLGSLKTGPTGPPGPYQIGLHLKLNSIRNPTSGDAQLFFQHFAHFCAFLHTFFCVFSHIFGSFFNFF